MYHQPVNLLQLPFDKYTINLQLHAEWYLLLKATLFRKEIVGEFVVFKCHLTKKQRDISFAKVFNLWLRTLLWSYEQNNENFHQCKDVNSFQSVIRFSKFISLISLAKTFLNLIGDVSFNYKNIPLWHNYQDC